MLQRISTLTTITALLTLALPCRGNGSGFQPGELVLYSPALNGPSSTDGGVARIDVATGVMTTVVDLTGGTQGYVDSIAYDAYRDRLLFVGKFPSVNDPTKLWAFDGFGNATDLGFDGVAMNALAPASGGRVYVRVFDPASPLRYLDSSNQLHTVMDASGTQPFAFPLFDVRAMVWDAGTNSLFAALPQNAAWNCGNSIDVSVQRLRLSADGTRVLANDGCVSLQADPGGGNRPVGLTRMSDGDLLLTIDTNSGGPQARMHRIDPVTMTGSIFSQNTNYGAGATDAGTWSSALQKAVILDTFGDALRAFDSGQTSEGLIIATSSPVSPGGSSSEVASLIEIPLDTGQSLQGTYCTPKTSSSGCQPTIATAGCPSASQPSGFTVAANQIEAQRVGLFFYGLNGAATIPFQDGTLCSQPPLRRTLPLFSGGAAPCSGAFTLDFNAYAASGADPLLLAGTVVNGQYWFRDPAAVKPTGITDAATFTLAP